MASRAPSACAWSGGGAIAAAESGGLLERYRVATILGLAPHPEEPCVHRAHPCTVRVAASDTKGIIDVTKGMSLNDSYYVVPADEAPCFAEYNLFSNSFDTVLSIIAYTGRIPSSQVGSGIPSELSPSGSFPKTWRVVNGQRVLYKAAHADGLGFEPVSEYLASQVAAAMGLPHVAYDLDVGKSAYARRAF